jgi:hypothetical protein
VEFAAIVALILVLVVASLWVMTAVEKRDAQKPASVAVAVPSSGLAPPSVAAPPPATVAAIDEPDGLKIFGWMLFLAGACLLVAAFVVSSSVEVSASSSLLGGYSGLMPERVANMDKMNLKLMLAVAGGATMICGSIFIARK